MLESTNLANQQSGNVIAEVPGRDPTLAPSSSAVIRQLGPGHRRDRRCIGSRHCRASAKRIMDAGRPLRTIRIVWFGAEETGLFGGLDYRAKYGKQLHYA